MCWPNPLSRIGGPGGSPPWRVQGGALVGHGAKPHRKKTIPLLLLLTYLLPTTPLGWAENISFTQSQCVKCHQKEHSDLIADWSTSSHALAIPVVDCVACHGNRHDNNGTARRNATCTTCHDGFDKEATQSYHLSKHGIIATLESERWDWSQSLVQGNYRTPTCAYCHMHGGNHTMGGKYRPTDPLIDPGADERQIVLDRRLSPCYDCHSPRFASTWFTSGERMIAVGRMKAREGVKVMASIQRLGQRKETEKAGTILTSMVDEHLRNVRLGVFHQSPDHQWWHGHPALDGDLLRLKGVLGDLLRRKNLNFIPTGKKGVYLPE